MPISNEQEPLVVTIVGKGSTCLTLEFGAADGRCAPYEEFVSVRVRAEVRGFRADFTEELALGELYRFQDALEALYRDLRGTAELLTLEDWLTLRGGIGGTGGVGWEARLRYPVGDGAELRFEIEADQSYLPPTLAQLRAVRAAYTD